jgi:plastocyanin
MDLRDLQADAHAPTRMRWLLLPSAVLAGLALAATAAGDDGRARATASSADAMVTAMASNTFDPAAVTIGQGETVTWTNVGGGEHNVVFEDGSFTSPATPSSSNWTVSRSFSTAGTFRYYCARHTYMTGTVTVTGAAPPPPTPGPPPPAAGKTGTTVTLRVSDASPTRRQRVRFFGSVKPERDGRVLQLQRRIRGGSYRTVERIRLRDAGAGRSIYSKRLRVLKDSVFRARLRADDKHLAGISRTRRVNVR